MSILIKFVIFVLCAICLGLFLWWQDKSVVVTRKTLKLEEKKKAGSFRVVQLSDLQSNWFGVNQENVVNKVKDLTPDVVVITGDIIDRRHTSYEAADKLLMGLTSAGLSVCYVNGNHECLLNKKRLGEFYSKWEDKINILINRNIVLNLNGVGVKIAGLDEDVVQRARGYERGTKDVDKSLIWESLDTIFDSGESMDVNLLLSHEPQLVDLYDKTEADIVFSGHAHGGQVRLPFIGGLYAPEQGIFPKYKEGLYNLGETWLVVSRGLGNSRFPFRVFNRPEVMCLDVEVLE